ncbi:DUF1353 domain-containing protein [Brevundimonas subvibrioides]|uniref:DUF1353 domain-containing protein n=1 Tax=Brevundimonas subvibrioides (strain ATCC 15264 / DSM 4735 / LMG 14903 / NBRC 16000 / CB 81) TaxID=633149 RepID=D9QI76_BRESC|nr:DUF1353 domain-containing protein [Brevundimonas subvibrioides]ADK99378.1 protein of unknown function DUF1353 [Brevundimonas subvibrioides ATCC 15264]
MSRFTDATWRETGETRAGRPIVCLTSPLSYDVGFLGSGWAITAPEGFCTDLASIPRLILRTEWGQRLAGQIARSAVVHDRMRTDRRWPKLLGDYVFLEAMGVDGVSRVSRAVAFVAVLLNFNRD